jgi:hypothetical protein
MEPDHFYEQGNTVDGFECAGHPGKVDVDGLGASSRTAANGSRSLSLIFSLYERA